LSTPPTQKLPIGQSTQSESVDFPAATVYLPALQAEQAGTDATPPGPYLPAGQMVHPLAAARVSYPGRHLAHLEASESLHLAQPVNVAEQVADWLSMF